MTNNNETWLSKYDRLNPIAYAVYEGRDISSFGLNVQDSEFVLALVRSKVSLQIAAETAMLGYKRGFN